MARLFSWLKRLSVVTAMAVAVVAAVCAVVLGPYVRDDVRLDWAVKAVALDWRDFGEDKAVERLQYELDHQGIGPWVADEDCALSGEHDEERQVSCRWTADIEVPGADVVIPLSFQSRARIDRSGDIL